MIYSDASECVILNICNYSFKVATSPVAIKELQHESQMRIYALQDKYWGRYVLPINTNFKILGVSKKLENFDSSVTSDLLYKMRERSQSSDKSTLNVYKLNNFNQYIYPSLKKSSKSRYQELCSLSVNMCSQHGDFYTNNILKDGGQPYLIDWSDFRTMFWSYYDEVHFMINEVCQKKHVNWMEALQSFDANELLFSKEGLNRYACRMLYAACRIDIEIDLELRKKKQIKKEKYIKIFETVCSKHGD